jgi:hypothetical protein
MRRLLSAALAAITVLFACPAGAATQVVYSTVPAGQANFDATVTGAGGTVATQVLESGETSYTDFTMSASPVYTYAEITGTLASIAPNGTTQGPNGDSRGSGVTFNFAGPVNSFGLNVGDWGTCCFPSSLYIAFDGGAPILVGTADTGSPAPLTNGQFSIFVGAFDDTGTFSTVEFWGDGFGEALYGGGTIRYAAIDVGSLPGAVPEPASWAMMIVGFGAIGGLMRRRKGSAKLALA